MIPTPPTLAGIFFCLASAEGAGLLFCPAVIQPHTSVYSVFCAINAVYTSHTAKQRTWLYRGISGYFPCFAPIIQRCILLCCTACATLKSIQASAAPPAHTRYRRHAGRCAGQHSRPIIIMYIRGQGCASCYKSMQDSAADRRPCQPGGVSASTCTGPARQLAIWHRVSSQGAQAGTLHPAEQSSNRGAAGRRGTIDGYRRISFRAVAR